MAAVTICSNFGAQENKVSHCFHCFPSICHEVMGLDAIILVFWMLSFMPVFSFSSFTFIKKLFSSSSLSAIKGCYLRIWGYWYFSKQSWFQLVLYPNWHFAWCNQSVVSGLVLTVASWSAYKFLRRQVRWSGIPISLRTFHSLLWPTQSKALV